VRWGSIQEWWGGPEFRMRILEQAREGLELGRITKVEGQVVVGGWDVKNE